MKEMYKCRFNLLHLIAMALLVLVVSDLAPTFLMGVNLNIREFFFDAVVFVSGVIAFIAAGKNWSN